MNGERPPRPQNANAVGLSDHVWELMCQCWREDHIARPSTKSVLESVKEEIMAASIETQNTTASLVEEAKATPAEEDNSTAASVDETTTTSAEEQNMLNYTEMLMNTSKFILVTGSAGCGKTTVGGETKSSKDNKGNSLRVACFHLSS